MVRLAVKILKQELFLTDLARKNQDILIKTTSSVYSSVVVVVVVSCVQKLIVLSISNRPCFVHVQPIDRQATSSVF